MAAPSHALHHAERARRDDHSAPPKAGSTWPPSSISIADGSSAGRLALCLPAGLLYHSNRGVQYAYGGFRVASMSRKSNCYDNAAMESFWNSFKRKCADAICPAREDGTTNAFDYIETVYNRVLLHSALGYQSPVDFENQLN